MALSIVHNKVATLPDEAGAEVNKNEWNEPHSVSGTVDLATTVTTNADLTGPVTSAGNATTISPAVVTEAMQLLADNTTQNVTSTKHGYVPKSPGDATKFLNGAATPAWTTPSPMVYANTTVPAGNTIANSNTETAFASTYTIAANTLAVGKKIKVKAWGVYGTDLIAPTLQGRLRFGGVAGTLMLDTGAISSIAGVTNGGWWAEAEFIVQTIGATGTIEAQAYAEFATAATTGLSVNLENTGPVTVDTTADKAIAITIQWGTADADNTITLRIMSVEIM